MPLYRKAIGFNPEDLENMTFEDCYELLLIFRYLDFRNDTTLTKEFIKTSMEQLRNRMLELKPDVDHYPGIFNPS
jgi:hypothetical protein